MLRILYNKRMIIYIIWLVYTNRTAWQCISTITYTIKVDTTTVVTSYSSVLNLPRHLKQDPLKSKATTGNHDQVQLLELDKLRNQVFRAFHNTMIYKLDNTSSKIFQQQRITSQSISKTVTLLRYNLLKHHRTESYQKINIQKYPKPYNQAPVYKLYS